MSLSVILKLVEINQQRDQGSCNYLNYSNVMDIIECLKYIRM